MRRDPFRAMKVYLAIHCIVSLVMFATGAGQ